ncbi:MAG: protein kinase [bacterium]|nr:protein kinase [bacterium]
MLRIGMFLQDRYEILEKIGSGGMSDVYKARCHKLNRLVAVKVLKEEFSSDMTFVGKFRIEAQAAAGLSHPNIVNVYDVIDEENIHAIVMELVEGITLKEYIKKKGHLEARESIGIAIQVCQGIAAAHEQHIIHRDIKPQNIMISKDGKVKVTDFGIARAVTAQTIGANVMGSVHYISPEQVRGHYSDERSDIYSLGITMYEMVTGQVPFDGDNAVAIALAHLETPLTPPRQIVKEIPVSLEKLILKCTEKRKNQRYSNMEDVIADLRKILINPGEDFVEPVPSENTDATIPIGYQERKILNDWDKAHGQGGVHEEPDKEIIHLHGLKEEPRLDLMEHEYEYKKRSESSAAAEARSQGMEGYSDEEIDRMSPERHRQETNRYREDESNDRRYIRRLSQEEEDTDKFSDNSRTMIEKIMIGLGVICSLVLIGIVIFIAVRLGNGILSRPTPTTAATSEVSATDGGNMAAETSTESTTLSETQVKMPPLVGLSVEAAEEKLKENTLTIKVEYQASDEVEKGYVISQQFPENTPVDRYSAILVTVSEGSDKINLDTLSIVGGAAEDVRTLLQDHKLVVEILEETSETVETGRVIRYTPTGKVAPQSTVTLTVSTGPAVSTILVPNLIGMTEANAISALENAKLQKGTVSQEYSETIGNGLVIRQNINPNSEVEEGTAVDFIVSQGPSPRHYKYVASIDDSCNLKTVFGPGSATSSIQVEVRLKQKVNGEDVYKVLMEPRVITGDTILPIKYNEIEGAENVYTGEIEVVDTVNGTILRTYNLNFFKVEVYGE